jgi:hypothetical protein
MAITFTSVAYVILQATKKKTTQEKKRQQEQRTHTKKIDEWITSWLQRASQSKLIISLVTYEFNLSTY